MRLNKTQKRSTCRSKPLDLLGQKQIPFKTFFIMHEAGLRVANSNGLVAISI